MIDSPQIPTRPNVRDIGDDTKNDILQPSIPEIVNEQSSDCEIKVLSEAGKLTGACESRYLIQDDILYYLSSQEEGVRPSLYVRKGLKCEAVNQCQDTSEYR